MQARESTSLVIFFENRCRGFLKKFQDLIALVSFNELKLFPDNGFKNAPRRQSLTANSMCKELNLGILEVT